MEAPLKGAVLIALVVVPQWRCPILKPLSAKLPPKSETAPHLGWQDGTILELSQLVMANASLAIFFTLLIPKMGLGLGTIVASGLLFFYTTISQDK